MSEIASFPIIFFDGKRESDAGNIRLDPSSLRFKKFESVIRQKIGIPHLPISISFICRRNPKSASENRRKIPIHEKSNFAAIAREKGGYFHVDLKPSKVREKPYRYLESDDFKLLRRDPAAGLAESGRISPLSGEGLGLGLKEYEKHLELQTRREEYMRYTNLYAQMASEIGYVDYTARGVVVCEECMGAKERPIPFHSCVYDTVTFGFRSMAGPIQRPPKGKTGF